MQLYLVDDDAAVAAALREAFRPFPEVMVQCADLLAVAHNTIVSPANAAGFMDGGLDAALRRFFGPRVEERAREMIGRRAEGYLPVGASLVVPTGQARVPYLLVAPTMLAPEQIDREGCYRAMRAVLRVAAAQEEVGRAVFCPGLGTGVGRVPPEEAAQAMAQAYADWKGPARR